MSLIAALILSATLPEKVDCLQTPSENGDNTDRVAFYITPEKIDRIALVFSDYDNQPLIDLTFSDLGNVEFLKLQKGRIGKSIALCMGNRLLTEPRLHEPILGGKAQISGDFTVAQIEALIAELNPSI